MDKARCRRLGWLEAFRRGDKAAYTDFYEVTKILFNYAWRIRTPK